MLTAIVISLLVVKAVRLLKKNWLASFFILAFCLYLILIYTIIL